MSKIREPLFGIAVGRKGVGKTYATLTTIAQYLKGNPQTGAIPRKVLILDTNNEFGNAQKDFNNPNFPVIKAIRLEDIRKFTFHPTIEARRVSVLKEGGGKMTLDELASALKHILDNYQNGLLLIEDITKFVSDSMPNDLIGSIVTQRHVSVDVITHFQSIGKMAHPKLWANANWIRMHKCDDTVERHKNKFAGETEHLKILEKMVDIEFKKGNARFHAYLDKDYGKIRGAFKKSQFNEAIVQYLEENYNTTIKPMMNKIDLTTGNKKYNDHNQVVQEMIKKFTDDYYGN